MPIRACLDCGSDRLVFPKAGTTTFTCDDCGWKGLPAEFPNYTAWQQGRATRVTLREKPAAPPPADGQRVVA